MYVANTCLRALTLEAIRWAVPSVRDLVVAPVGDLLIPGNWRVASLDVPSNDADAARAEADALEMMGAWVWVPDGHPLDGMPFGGDGAERGDDPLPADTHPLLALARAVQAVTGEDFSSTLVHGASPMPIRLPTHRDRRGRRRPR